MSSFRSAAKFAPTDPIARAYYGDALLTKGSLVEAEAELREALRLQPGYVYAQGRLDVLLKAIRPRIDCRERLREKERKGPLPS